MPDERKRKLNVVVGRESCRHVNSSEAVPEIGEPLIVQFPLHLPIVHEAVVGEGARSQVEDEGTEADSDSEIRSVDGPLSIVGGCESEGITFQEAVGRAGLISVTETALDTAGLPIC